MLRNNEETIITNITSNPLVGLVITLRGGRCGAYFRRLTRCDVIKSIISTISKGEGAVVRATNAGEGSSRRVSNCKIKKFRVGLVNPTYKTLNFPHPLKEGGISVSRNNFPLSIFNSPLLMRENRRVHFNAPQPTTKEVLC